jgi:hypothetical protein
MNVGNQRRLTYFFGHFPYMAATIVMLRGIAILLGFTVCSQLFLLSLSSTPNWLQNLYKAAKSMAFVDQYLPWPQQGHPEICDVANITKALAVTDRQFWQSGLSFHDWISKWSDEICLPVSRGDNETELLALDTKFSKLLMEPIVFLFDVSLLFALLYRGC